MLKGKKKECLLNVRLSRIDVGLGVLGSEVKIVMGFGVILIGLRRGFWMSQQSLLSGEDFGTRLHGR